MVAKRMQRQQVLYQPAKRVRVVMLEGALRVRVVSVPTLIGRLYRLICNTARLGSTSLYELWGTHNPPVVGSSPTRPTSASAD